MATSTTIIVGNPKAGSRTRALAEEVVRQVHGLLGERAEPTVVDLAEHTGGLFDWGSAEVTGLVEQVLASDLVVVASPTYKATYTGLLKVFIDRFSAGSLGGTPAVPVMTGGNAGHTLAVEHGLRPLLVEIGASVPTRGLYVTEAEIGDPPAPVAAWLDSQGEILTAAVRARVG